MDYSITINIVIIITIIVLLRPRVCVVKQCVLSNKNCNTFNTILNIIQILKNTVKY